MKLFLKQIMAVIAFVFVSTGLGWGGEYVVTGPDGKEYDVTAPEGASEAQIIAAVKRRYYKETSSPTEIYNYLVREGYLGANQLTKEERLEQRLELMEQRLEKMEDCLIFKLFCN